jgi:heterodisulfide reductase subunit A
MVTIEINGISYDVEPGKTVLEVARLNNIEIPTLCYNKALEPYGACRLCVVEILGDGWSNLTTSCDLPVKDGLRIQTESEKVIKSRKMTVELLAARCTDETLIKELTAEYKINKIRFKKDHDDCIQCGLCVRMCDRMGSDAISFSGRGKDRQVVTPWDETSNVCLTCGACAFICPTSRFTQDNMEENSGKKPIPILSEFNADLSERPAVYFPFPQAVPKIPVIDKDRCVYYQNGECKTCEKFCDPGAIVYGQQDKKKKFDVGAIVVAPGLDVFDAAKKPEFRYRQYSNVITSLEFERILSPSGPTEGEIEISGNQPKKIAWIQCVGSRDPHINRGYCSSVCCMYAVKEAIIAKEHAPDIEPTIFYMDMRAYGKDFDKYIDRAEEDHGIRLVRSRIADIEEDPRSKHLLIKYEAEDGFLKEEEYDMVVLSIGINPPKDIIDLAIKCGIDLNKYNFAKTNSFSPFQTTQPGIFVAGAFIGPKDIPETVAQASGVVAEVTSLLSDVQGENVIIKEYPPEIDVSQKPARIGVFICHCGSNIAGFLNIKSIVDYAKNLPKVVYAEDSLYSCSQDTQNHIKDIIKKYDLTRVVIASCTPRTHESLFQDTIREAGLNKHLFEMANIRDQCSWVHMNEPKLATEKAKQLVSMAVAKSSLLKPLSMIKLEINHAGLVIGGGLTGIMAALKLADEGFEVYLLEKKKELGGNLHEIFY